MIAARLAGASGSTNLLPVTATPSSEPLGDTLPPPQGRTLERVSCGTLASLSGLSARVPPLVRGDDTPGRDANAGARTLP